MVQRSKKMAMIMGNGAVADSPIGKCRYLGRL